MEIIIFDAVKKIAVLFLFVFSTFLVAPSIVAYIDNSVDISFAYTANEEENSSKNLLELQLVIEKDSSNYDSLHFLQEQKANGHYYKFGAELVYLEVLSPPPKHIS